MSTTITGPLPTFTSSLPTVFPTTFDPPKPLSTDQMVISKLFYAILLVPGNILIPILMIIALYYKNTYSKSILFMNFWVSWIGWCIGFLFMFYSGDWNRVPDQPAVGLCQIQTVIVFVTPVWTSSTTVALILQLWLSVVSLARPSPSKVDPETAQLKAWNERARLLVLAWAPYIIALIYGFGAFMVTMSRPDLVRYDFLFCTVNFQPLRTSVALYSAIVLLLATILQLDIGRRLYQQRLAVKQVRVQGWPVISLFSRMMLFVVVSLSGIIASILATTNNALENERSLVQGAIPLVSFLIFGTSTGIYRPDAKSR